MRCRGGKQERLMPMAIDVRPHRENAMRVFAATILLLLSGSNTFAQAPSSGGSGSAASSSGAGGAGGSTLSNGSTVNGTGGSPGHNTSNALNHGTTGNNLGANPANQGGAPSPSAAVNTPAANSAVNSLSNTDTGILKK
jgi:hypothetical protein